MAQHIDWPEPFEDRDAIRDKPNKSEFAKESHNEDNIQEATALPPILKTRGHPNNVHRDEEVHQRLENYEAVSEESGGRLHT
mmetsp:Transcript_36685/g.87590  ORF Transcript_36685/g.87590 Transcript_36685/m.87590 type:complete len:82 (-) Transcript_36685:1212-1457(-)